MAELTNRDLGIATAAIIVVILIAGYAFQAPAPAPAVVPAVSPEVQATLNQMQSSVNQLQSSVSGLSSSVNQLQSSVSNLQSSVAKLEPAPAAAPLPSTTGWDTEESIRGGLKLVAQFDSSGPDAWSAADHPMVYFSSESSSNPNPARDPTKPYFAGFHIVDAYSKEVVASYLADSYKGEKTRGPHGVTVSMDGKWAYVGWTENVDGEDLHLIGIVNFRTLKLDKLLTMDRKTGWDITSRRVEFGTKSKPLHHLQAFKDWEGNDRVILQMGFGARGGPHYILDSKDDNRVWKSITYDEVHPMGHPYTTPSPDGKYVYISMGASWIREADSYQAGIARLNLETGEVTVFEGVGSHPIGICHTMDGKYTYVIEGTKSFVFKLDNHENEVVGHTSAGVAGPYGCRLNWDETLLFTVGKGEGSHNTGGVLGLVDTKTFRQKRIRTEVFNLPIQLGGSASSVDHAILHPDPDVNELWVSNMNGWETIVLDIDTLKPTDYIPTPNGGDTHSGGFAQCDSNWNCELLADHGGPKAQSVMDIQRQMAAAAAAQ